MLFRSAFGNAGGMNSFGDLSGIDTSKKVAGEKTNSNLNGGLDNGNQMKLDPALLRTGTANDIMGQFENRFGLERDQFAENVIGGRDPRELLATAPKNPISVGNLNKAITSAQSLSSEDKARASSALLAAAQKEMSDKLGAGTLADADAGARGQIGRAHV